MTPRGWVVAVLKPAPSIHVGYAWAPAYDGAVFASKRIALEMAERYRGISKLRPVRVLREGIVR